jgi:hypothetical protein
MRAAPLEFSTAYEAQALAAQAVKPAPSVVALHRKPPRGPRVMLATTGQLPSTARLAMELADTGATVSLVSPRNHPARVLTLLGHRMVYRALAPGRSLKAAMLRARPDLVIPCDERAVRDMHQLWRTTRDTDVRNLIERSVGPAEAFPTVVSRDALMSLARRVGVRVPPSAPLPGAGALTEWTAGRTAPFVLKADGSWAGFGVRVISDPAVAQGAYAHMTRPAGLRLALREMLLEGNSFGLRAWWRRERPAMSVQGYIDGWPANIGVACWQGEILASTCAESVATESATGPSTVARIINNPEMREAARRIVKALNLSGLVGFDFMIEAATGDAWMIEMNARNTPICAVRLGGGRDLAEALAAKVAGRPVRERPPRTERDIVVFFPDTWRRDPSNQFLRNGYHDVPWEQPELVRRLMKREMRDRYWVTRMLRRLWLKLAADARVG